MKKIRTPVNVATFLVASFLLVWFGADRLVFQETGGPRLIAEFDDSSGIQPRNDVTIRGLPVGTVDHVELTETGVRVEMALTSGTVVPEGTKALITRRSPIGELTIELEPGDGPPLLTGAVIEVDDTIPPPDVSTTIKALRDVLHSVPSGDLETMVGELANAVRGRARDLALFTDASAQLPERLLEVRSELESLIRTGPKLTGVFADNADTFADDLRQTAILADILRERRFDLVELYRKGAVFSDVAGDLLKTEKANIACFIKDAGTLNEAVAARRDKLAGALDMNHFFFGAVEQTVQEDSRGYTWFRVQLQPHTEPSGRSYTPKRDVPDVFPGRACTSRYGDGVGAADQRRVHLAPKSNLRR
jgi:phospholipid/cholesterol/gamma-HCH transport system substrate-binding protein